MTILLLALTLLDSQPLLCRTTKGKVESRDVCKTGETLVDVREADEKMVASCAFLGDITASSNFGGLAQGKGQARARLSAMKRAAEKGATHLVWQNLSSGWGGGNASGRAYKCELKGASPNDALSYKESSHGQSQICSVESHHDVVGSRPAAVQHGVARASLRRVDPRGPTLPEGDAIGQDRDADRQPSGSRAAGAGQAVLRRLYAGRLNAMGDCGTTGPEILGGLIAAQSGWSYARGWRR